MARGELLRKLFLNFSRNEREGFFAAATEIIEEERAKNHVLLARDLEKILQNGNGKSLASNGFNYDRYPEVPKDRETGLPLIDVQRFDYSWDRVILSETNLAILQTVALENRKQEVLEAYGLKPKLKLLFCGPPGCGKTLTAKVMSGVLGIPLVYVNLTAVFSSFLGETATNLKKIFSYVETGEWVVLFDEFDAIARDRNTFNEHGEVKRLVNSLLQLIDTSNSKSLFIAATNHESLLDTAVWRRFDEILFFDKPSVKLKVQLLTNYLSAFRYEKISLEEIAILLEGATGADIERICADAMKAVILRGDRQLTHNDLQTSIRHYIDRQSIVTRSVTLLRI